MSGQMDPPPRTFNGVNRGLNVYGLRSHFKSMILFKTIITERGRVILNARHATRPQIEEVGFKTSNWQPRVLPLGDARLMNTSLYLMTLNTQIILRDDEN